MRWKTATAHYRWWTNLSIEPISNKERHKAHPHLQNSRRDWGLLPYRRMGLRQFHLNLTGICTKALEPSQKHGLRFDERYVFPFDSRSLWVFRGPSVCSVPTTWVLNKYVSDNGVDIFHFPFIQNGLLRGLFHRAFSVPPAVVSKQCSLPPSVTVTGATAPLPRGGICHKPSEQ